MHGGDPARDGVGEDDGDAVGRGDHEKNILLVREKSVPFSEEEIPPLTRRLFEGECGAAVDLFQAEHLGVRRAERLGERTSREIRIEGAGSQAAAGEPGGEPGRAGKGKERNLHSFILRKSSSSL